MNILNAEEKATNLTPEYVYKNVYECVTGMEQIEKYFEATLCTKFLDLNVTYKILLDENNEGRTCTILTKNIINHYGLNVEKIYECARNNNKKRMNALSRMQDVIMGFQSFDGVENLLATRSCELEEDEKDVMYVMSSDMLNGASIIMYKDVMQKARTILGEDFYIFPSSIHELMLVPRSFEKDVEKLKNTVKDINATQVAPEERLSNSVYAWDNDKKEVVICQ